MARSPEEKKLRVEFLATSEEQKQKFILEADKLGYSIAEFFRQAGEAMISGQTLSPSVDERKDKLLADKEAEIEQLRAALGIKMNANTQLNDEVRTLRARLYGEYKNPDTEKIASHIEELIESRGTISRKELLASIEDSHKVKNLINTLEEVESRLRWAKKIFVNPDGVIQWVGKKNE